MKLEIHESVKQSSPNFSLGYIVVRNITVQGTPPSLAQEFFHLQVEAAKFYNIDELVDIPPFVSVRGMYKKNHFNPTRRNQASEDLVRRVLQRKGVYYVNSAVAVNNYCALNFLLPFGLYDLDKIEGNITYQLDAESTYINIAGKDVMANSKPFLADGKGIFGNPISDARRTAVTLTTRNVLLVVYADEEVASEELTDILDFAGEMIVRHNGGTVDIQDIIKP